MSHDILILSHDAEQYLPLLAEVEAAGGRLLPAETVGEALARGGEAAILLARPDLAAAALPGLPGLRWLQSTWAGVTPLLEAPRRDYLLTGVRDVFGPQMAEYVLGHLLARELRIDARRACQARREWRQDESGTFEGKTMGIMGTGSIGSHIARAAAVFDLRVIGYSSNGRAHADFQRVYPGEQLFEFLAECDYVVGVLPDTAATRQLLNREALAAMRPGSVLVNVGRGSLVDETALVYALARGRPVAAVLDVFAEEPLPKDSPLWDTPGVTVTAHVSGISRVPDIARIFRRNYNHYVAGEPLDYVIDFERGY